jgi:hypothetical protein
MFTAEQWEHDPNLRRWIIERAYGLWRKDGCPEGLADEHSEAARDLVLAEDHKSTRRTDPMNELIRWRLLVRGASRRAMRHGEPGCGVRADRDAAKPEQQGEKGETMVLPTPIAAGSLCHAAAVRPLKSGLPRLLTLVLVSVLFYHVGADAAQSPQTGIPNALPPGTNLDTPGGSSRHGVIPPPMTGDTGINKGPPAVSEYSTPVIPPPGSPGGSQHVQPK